MAKPGTPAGTSSCPRISAWAGALALLAALWLPASGAAQGPLGPAIIDNGVVQLGVDVLGQLNVPGGSLSSNGTTVVGLRFVPTNGEATAPGCLCEGWGVADAASAVTGFANNSAGTSANLVQENAGFVVTGAGTRPESAGRAVRVVTRVLDSTGAAFFRVTHDYKPAVQSPNLYQVTVTIENLSNSDVPDLRYRRVMDWDIPPTTFSEIVTIQGSANAANVTFASDNGVASANPLSPGGQLLFSGDALNSGPADHGALFDFAFGSLEAGEALSFDTFYGAGANRAQAEAAVAAVGAEVYSLGQANDGNPEEPGPADDLNTFVFAFRGVGGEPPPPVETNPPVCDFSESGGVLSGTVSDSGEGDTGIFFVFLEEGTRNATLEVVPDPFVLGTTEPIGVSVSPTDPALPYFGRVTAFDGAGNSCSAPFGSVRGFFTDWAHDNEVVLEESGDRTLYVAADTQGLKIIDPDTAGELGTFVATPVDPLFPPPVPVGAPPALGRCTSEGFTVAFRPFTVDVWDGIAYVGAGQCGVVIGDVSNPASPALLGAFDTDFWVTDAEAYPGAVVDDVETTLVFATDFIEGLKILDVGDPASPIEIGSFGPANQAAFGEAVDVALYSGDVGGTPTKLALVATSRGLRIVDVSSPGAPSLAGQFDTDASPASLESPQDVEVDAQAQLAYLSIWFGGLLQIDFSDPANPVPVDSVVTPDRFFESAVEGDKTYAAEGAFGLNVFQAGSLDHLCQNPIGPMGALAWDVEVADGFAYVAWGNPADGSGGFDVVGLDAFGLPVGGVCEAEPAGGAGGGFQPGLGSSRPGKLRSFRRH